MPIKIKTDIDFGDVFYLKGDPEQLEHRLIAVVILPGNQVKLGLSFNGEITYVYDFEASKEKDVNKIMGIDDKDE